MILYALGLWLLALVSAMAFTSVVVVSAKRLRENSPWAGVVMQVGYVVFSLLAAHFLAGGLEVVGSVSPPLRSLLEASAVSALLALVSYAATVKVLREEEYVSPFVPRNVVEFALLAFIAAPIGEEVLFRGLLEGYLLARNMDLCVAVALPAVLFSLVHWVTFGRAPAERRALVLFFALVAGLVAGYYRAVTGSIAVPVVVHAIFNTPGLAQVPKRTREGQNAE